MLFPKPAKREKKAKKPIRKHSKNPLPRAKKRAWDAWSLYLRLSNADINGNVRCFSCGHIYHWKDTQAGHYIHKVMDFDPYNVNPQCRRCNKYLDGNTIEYGEQIKKLYGVEIHNNLLSRRHEEINYTISDYEELEAKFKNKLNNL